MSDYPNLFYSYKINYSLPGLREKELITAEAQKQLFQTTLCKVAEDFLAYDGGQDFFLHHQKRLAEKYNLDLEEYEDRLKLKKYLETFFDLQTYEGKKKFIGLNLVKFETLEFADILANKIVLEFIFQEFIKNALKFAQSGTVVEFYTTKDSVKMINENGKRRFCGGSGMGKKLLHLYARKSGSIFRSQNVDNLILSAFDFS